MRRPPATRGFGRSGAMTLSTVPARGPDTRTTATPARPGAVDSAKIVSGELEVHQISLKLKLTSGLPLVNVDRLQFRQVFLNLLTNAAEALEGHENGAVAVRAQSDPARGLARISVTDNGPGFSQEERARMFEPYFSRKKTGTGLGLTIVRSIVMDHKGNVRVEAASPRGSIFLVELPLA